MPTNCACFDLCNNTDSNLVDQHSGTIKTREITEKHKTHAKTVKMFEDALQHCRKNETLPIDDKPLNETDLLNKITHAYTQIEMV